MSANSTLSILAALAAIGFSGVAQQASAQDRSNDPDAVSVKVSYADLDLSRSAGVKVLLHRINEAAKDICGEPDRDLALQSQTKACLKATTDRAVASVNAPLVTAMNSGQPTSTVHGMKLASRDH